MCGAGIPRVEGMAVYLSPDANRSACLIMKHNKVLHERIVFLTVVSSRKCRTCPTTNVFTCGSCRARPVYQALMHYGFWRSPDVARGMKLLAPHGLTFDSMLTTFFLANPLSHAATRPGLLLGEGAFRWMQPQQPATAEYFKLLPERVIELARASRSEGVE